MKKISKKKPIIAFLMIMSMVFSGIATVDAQTDIVRVSSYDDLPINYVRIKSPTFDQCTFETTNPDVKMMDYYDLGNGNKPHIVYVGPLNWGKDRTSTQNASLGTTNVAGSFTLRAKDMAILPDGTKADLLLTFTDWQIMVGTRPAGVSAGQTLYTCILNDLHGLLKYKTISPKTSPSATTSLNTNMAQRITTTVNVLRSGTDEPIDEEDYPNMLIVWQDFDVADLTTAYGSSEASRYAGKYSEGIGMISGFRGSYYATPKTATVSQIIDGVQKIRGSRDDDYTLDSGGIFVVSPQEYSYYWYGSRHPSGGSKGNSMGSDFQGSPEVTVLASAGEGGSIEKEGVTSYILNGQTTYDYTPAEGYKVKSLTVNGEDVAFDENGGTYRFNKLLERNPSGYDHTIDVQFRRYTWNIETEAVNGTITETEKGIPEGENRVITYVPDEGHRLVSLTVDGKPVDINEYPVSYPFKDIHEDHTIKAVFEKTPILEVEKSADKEVYNAGDRVTYTIRVKQTAEGAEARDVIIKDKLPEGLTLDEDSISGPVRVVFTAPGSYELSIGSLTDEITYTYAAVTDREVDGAELENIVTVTAANVPGDPAEARARISSLKPKPIITKTVSNENPFTGEEVTYTISVKEPQEGIEVRNAVVTDPIPEGVEIIEDSIKTEGDPATATFSDGELKVDIPILATETVITFMARVTAEEGDVINKATLTGNEIPQLEAEAPLTVKKPVVLTKTQVVDDPDPAPEDTPKKKEPEKPSKGSAPGTGDRSMVPIAIAAIALLASLAGAVTLRRRRL